MHRSLLYASGLCLISSAVLAQFPQAVTDLTTVNSQVDSEVTISFKETDVCERTPGVKSYSGYVNLPGGVLSDVGGYGISTYFIYFEARNNPSTAPLAIYLAGGPGESSTYAALSSENGPCYVDIDGIDTVNGTWSFNNYANLLYVDQPVMAGFSYDQLVNATSDLQGLITPIDFDPSSPPTVNASTGYGTYPSQSFNKTANNTVQAAKALWHFAEHWLSSFPGYATQSNEISIWGNSYGGYWVPETAVRFSEQLKNLTTCHPLNIKNLTVGAIGITNGCVDIAASIRGYPEFAYNNTYGVHFSTEELYDEVIQNMTMPSGCQDLIQQCRDLAQLSDSEFTGGNATVNELCMGAFGICSNSVINAFPDLQLRDAFDIAILNPLPCPFYLPVNQYLNSASIQASLGVPLNYTIDSSVVTANFGFPSVYSGLLSPSASTADFIRINGLSNIEYLLANNVKIAFIFGDRDYRCPWTGGEATALAANWTHQADFADAGYQELQGVESPKDQGGLGAVVKQYGAFSFSRVLDAGHSVSAYAPETVYRIFERTLTGVDVVTGQQSILGGYRTTGPRDSWGWRNTLPDDVPRTCIVDGQFTSTNPWDVVTGGQS